MSDLHAYATPQHIAVGPETAKRAGDRSKLRRVYAHAREQNYAQVSMNVDTEFLRLGQGSCLSFATNQRRRKCFTAAFTASGALSHAPLSKRTCIDSPVIDSPSSLKGMQNGTEWHVYRAAFVDEEQRCIF